MKQQFLSRRKAGLSHAGFTHLTIAHLTFPLFPLLSGLEGREAIAWICTLGKESFFMCHAGIHTLVWNLLSSYSSVSNTSHLWVVL